MEKCLSLRPIYRQNNERIKKNQKAMEEMGFEGCELEETDYERFRRLQIEQFEDDITEGRCYPEMPEGQFVRSK